MTSKQGLSIVALAIGMGGALACQVIAHLERPEAPPEAAADAGSDGPVAVSGLVNACDDATLSPPLHARVGTDLDAIDLAVGYFRSDVSHPPDAGVELCPSVGFNLDDRTTCLLDDGGLHPVADCAGDAACAWGPSCRNKRVTCDAIGGFDNSMGTLAGASSLKRFPQIDTTKFDANSILRSGQGNLLIRITGYNGEADDEEVFVTFFQSSGLASGDQPLIHPERALVDSGLPDADAAAGSDPTLERWDGRALREWYLDPDASDALVLPKGYVTNHVLVVRPTTIPLPIFGALLSFEQARFVGELRRRGQGWEIIRGRIGGRVSPTKAIISVASIPFKTNGPSQTLCQNATLMAGVQTEICGSADLGTESDGPCDAISIGASFNAVPAIISKTAWRRPVSVTYCDAGVYAECPQ